MDGFYFNLKIKEKSVLIRVICGENYVVFRVRKRRVTAANTSFSLHYKDTKFERQSQVFCELFSME